MLAGIVTLGALAVACGAGEDEGQASGDPPLTASTVASSVPAAPATTIRPAPTVTTTTTTAPPERIAADSRLSLGGIGPVDVGMTLEEASAAAGTPIRVRPGNPFGSECEYAYADAVPGMAFMVINGRIARVDVGSPNGGRVTTVSGIGEGSTEDEVKRTYPGRIQVQGHPYVPTGHYLVYAPADANLAHLSLIFETDGRVVTRFRSGMKGAVAQIEGCS
ncbi:MAG: hypothetical protein ACR2HM_10200 [Acidimicrobiales bacterium]